MKICYHVIWDGFENEMRIHDRIKGVGKFSSFAYIQTSTKFPVDDRYSYKNMTLALDAMNLINHLLFNGRSICRVVDSNELKRVILEKALQ